MSILNSVLRRQPDPTSSAFLVIAFLTGIAGALQLPTLSLFLLTEVKVNPLMVGLYYTGSAVIGIVVSQVLATRSDKQGDRKRLILHCCILGALGCVLYAWNRNYFILLIVGVILSSFGSTANPQLFALAREPADRTGREAAMFSSVMRAQISLSWVIGPPVAFALGLSEKLAGIMMGTAAGLEIPVMLIAGYVAKRVGKRILMRFAVGAGLLFYVGLVLFSAEWALLALQLLNTIFIGILAGIGMLYFQDLMPGQAGTATTLFTNTTRVGWIISGSLAGIVAQFWGYHAVFFISLLMSMGAGYCMWKIKDV